MPGRQSDIISSQIVYTATWENSLELLRQYNLLLLLLLLLLLFTVIELSLGGSSPYTSTDQSNKNKYT
jgi:hypothetical protein